jgi:hypothetical protein
MSWITFSTHAQSKHVLLSVVNRHRMVANVMGGGTEASGRVRLIKFPNAPSPGLYPFPLEDFAALQDIRDIMPA